MLAGLRLRLAQPSEFRVQSGLIPRHTASAPIDLAKSARRQTTASRWDIVRCKGAAASGMFCRRSRRPGLAHAFHPHDDYTSIAAATLAAWRKCQRRSTSRADVQPIFKQHCVECHGPSQQMRGLRLDRRRDAT